MVQSTHVCPNCKQKSPASLKKVKTRFVAKSFCFVAGTHITTIRGDIPVEELKSGDLIRAKSGAYVPVRTVAIYEVSAAQLTTRPDLQTVTIRRGALGEGIPRRDLHVTGGQEFDSALRMKIQHHTRMSVRTPVMPGGSGRKARYVTFECMGARAVRVERLWVTSTPCIDNFNLPRGGGRPLMAAAVPYSAA